MEGFKGKLKLGLGADMTINQKDCRASTWRGRETKAFGSDDRAEAAKRAKRVCVN